MFFVKLILFLVTVLISLTVHEYFHAKVAYNLGDPTAKYEGRLSLNPKYHIDPIGGLILLLSFIGSGGTVCFGWAKPVPINPSYFKDYYKDSMKVALAGPLANFALAAIAGSFIRFQLINSGFLLLFIHTLVIVNIGLGIFNLIPLPPLDGSRILAGLLPRDMAYKFMEFERKYFMILPIILLIIIVTPLLDILIYPPFRFLYTLFTGL